MPWRDEVELDEVEYSDTPKDDGPAPAGDEIERGDVAELETEEGVTVELQYWREMSADVDLEDVVSSAAPYFAWRVGDQSGLYGVFDGYATRVWFGMETPTLDGQEYAFIDFGEDWRKMLWWTVFADRVYLHHCQYPSEQQSDITPADVESLIDGQGTKRESYGKKSEVYEVLAYPYTTKDNTDEVCEFQAWKPKSCQAVFFAVRDRARPVWHATRGVLGRNLLLSDIGRAISFDDESFPDVYALAEDLRDDDVVGLHYRGE